MDEVEKIKFLFCANGLYTGKKKYVTDLSLVSLS